MMLIFVSGCQSSQSLYEARDMPNDGELKLRKEPVSLNFFGNKVINPLKLDALTFNRVGAWFDNETVLFVTDNRNGSTIYRYNLFTGEKQLFYTTDAPVVTLEANRDNNFFLIQTAPSSYVAQLTVLNKEGDEVYSWRTGASDLLYEWSPFQNGKVFVTTFYTDWSYRQFIINTMEQAIIEYELPEPFIQWLSKDDVAYMKWDTNEPSFTAPLVEINLNTKEEQYLFDDIFWFSTFSNMLFTIGNDQQDSSIAVYNFYDPNSHAEIFNARVSHLAKYSEWLIPFYQYENTKQIFYTFRPYESGSYDEYNKKFEFVAFSLQTGEEQVILSEVENMPFKLSPNGRFGLYGFQFERLIDLKEQKITDLIEM